MKRVTGIGGIFLKAKDAPAKHHVGVDVQAWGDTAFSWADADGKPMLANPYRHFEERIISCAAPHSSISSASRA